jgi:hypothetical protein
MWLRLSVLTRFAPLDEPLVLYRSVAGTMSSNLAVLERETFALLDKFFADAAAAPYAGLRRRAYANQWMMCAASYFPVRRLRDGFRCATAGVRPDHREPKRLSSVPAGGLPRARRRFAGQPSRDPKLLRRG